MRQCLKICNFFFLEGFPLQKDNKLSSENVSGQIDNTKVHPGPLLWSGLMYGLLSSVSWWLVSPDTECHHQFTRLDPHSLPSSELTSQAESGPTCRQEQTRAQGKQVECQLSSQYFSDGGIAESLIDCPEISAS